MMVLTVGALGYVLPGAAPIGAGASQRERARRGDVDRPAEQSAEQGKGSSRAVIVASKPFGESYLLAEMFAQLLESQGLAVERRPGLGATTVAFGALRSGAIDVYPEYTGTGLLAILHEPPRGDAQSVFTEVQRQFSERYGLRWLPPLGFENGYAVSVRAETAERYELTTLSDLARVAPRLSAGLSPDFIQRADGLPGLARAYGLRFAAVRPLDQALKYRALASGAVDVVDGYSTDGLIARYGLVVLRDDRHFFPPYQAAALIGARLSSENPRAVAVLTRLSGMLSDSTMRALNERVEGGNESIAQVASDALRELHLDERSPRDSTIVVRSGERMERSSFWSYLWARRATLGAQTLRHIELVGVSLLGGIFLALPLALILERASRAAEATLRILGVLETIPSIALLAFMIPLFGVGFWPAVVALWLYSLYPIARNTYTGVRDADPAAVHAARALGMTPLQVLRYVRTPLAAPSIMAGIRTAAVIDVGTATLAAFIGAGGLGEPIATGLALADTRLILSGALPAALLALVVDGLLSRVERWTTPAPLRHRAGR
ncbi:MAG TPA: glycine betaine ABC transporter substrate-binding protein [Gemmatimonadaceae bacterium]